MKTKVITVNWRDRKSYNNAVRLKSRYENLGYELIRTQSGETTKLVYRVPE